MRRLKFLKYLILIVGAVACDGNEPVVEEKVVTADPISPNRVAWDYTTLQKIAPLPGNTYDYTSYPRMIELQDGDFMCVYEANGNIDMIRSSDKGESWDQPVRIASLTANNILMAVPEIIQLANSNIIIAYNPRPLTPYSSDRKFAIAARISSDNGSTWGDVQTIYEADHNASNGCWEPQMMELPDGELQMYFANEADYVDSHEQNISMFRSSDGGVTWGDREIVSFSPTSRDGMPVALHLEETDEIIMAIEDNFQYNFKPVIIRTSDNWANAPVGRDTPDREYALNHDLTSDAYQGAPYIRQLPSGNIALSYQGTNGERDNSLPNSRMWVEIGDNTGRNFDNATKPFIVPTGKSALWSSLSVMDGRLWALTATIAYSGTQETWTIAGYEIWDYKIPTEINTENDPPFFIGHKGYSNVKTYLSQDASGLNILARIKDSSISVDNGVTFYLDPQNISAVTPVSNTYSIKVLSDGSYELKEGFNNKWESSSKTARDLTVNQTDSGYEISFSLDWDIIGGKPASEERIGFSMTLLETVYNEDLANSVNNQPYTWASAKL
ncbi:MAG: exo-alpha-sialidase [Bacteroidota bacterium]